MTWWDNRIGRNPNWGDNIQHPQRVWLANYDAMVGKRVLEIGYGTGKDYSGIRNRVGEYRGYDFTPSFQNVCRSMWPSGDFLIGDIRDIPEPDRSWDIVFCRHILEHVEDWQTALNELWRVTASQLIILPWRDLRDGPTIQKNKKVTPSNPDIHCWHFNKDEFMGAMTKLSSVTTIENHITPLAYIINRGDNADS